MLWIGGMDADRQIDRIEIWNGGLHTIWTALLNIRIQDDIWEERARAFIMLCVCVCVVCVFGLC